MFREKDYTTQDIPYI